VEFEEVERFAVGAFGEPGQRLFLLQVQSAGRVLTVKVEKGQVAELATHLTTVMADRPVEAADPAGARLEVMAEPEWSVGAIRLGYDNAAERVAVVLEEFASEEDAEPASALVLLSPAQAGALAAEIASLVAAGRPACELCGYPLDPSGHVCPRTNGHRPPKL
jgi:uncharacterized repeat protein (TIGR03847 family)